MLILLYVKAKHVAQLTLHKLTNRAIKLNLFTHNGPLAYRTRDTLLIILKIGKNSKQEVRKTFLFIVVSDLLDLKTIVIKEIPERNGDNKDLADIF